MSRPVPICAAPRYHLPIMRRIACLALLVVASPAEAQPQQEPAAAPAPRVQVQRSSSGQRIVRIQDSFVIEGRVQKPNAFYVLQRSSIDYDWEALKQDFLPKILKATTEHPF